MVHTIIFLPVYIPTIVSASITNHAAHSVQFLCCRSHSQQQYIGFLFINISRWVYIHIVGPLSYTRLFLPDMQVYSGIPPLICQAIVVIYMPIIYKSNLNMHETPKLEINFCAAFYHAA
jgi:hypothetical protein